MQGKNVLKAGNQRFFGFFGLFEELSTKVGFSFFNNGSKSQDLQFGMKIHVMTF